MNELIIASNNEGKIKEYKEVLSKFDFEIISQSEAGIDFEFDETNDM